jgi:ABC-type transporter Mla subunit MlaD
MSSNQQQKGKKKIGLNTVISWGASVVIIGLMFKILHWPGGELFIAAGLTTEAILFFILGIAAMSAAEEDTAGDKKASGLDDLLATAISPKVIERLSMGFQQFNKTVESVNAVAGSSNVTTNFVKEVEVATGDMKKFRDNVTGMTASFDQFNKSLQTVGQVASGAQNVMKDFESAGAGLKTFAKNITDMNASFDQFNKTIATLNQMTASTQTMMKEVEGVAVGIKAYNKSLTELSKIYAAQVEAFRKN